MIHITTQASIRCIHTKQEGRSSKTLQKCTTVLQSNRSNRPIQSQTFKNHSTHVVALLRPKLPDMLVRMRVGAKTDPIALQEGRRVSSRVPLVPVSHREPHTKKLRGAKANG